MSRQEELAPMLYLALAEPIGLLLRAEDPQRVTQAFHQAKYKAKDPALMVIQIRQVEHPEGNIALTKRAPKRDSE